MDSPPQAPPPAAAPERQRYEAPTLRVFGSVAAITANLEQDKGEMDGGNNRFKT